MLLEPKPLAGHKEKSLLYAIKCLTVDRHINLVVFLPTKMIDCLISLVSIELKKGQAKAFEVKEP